MSLDRPRPKNYRRAPVTEYRCQFCHEASPVTEWKGDGADCPKCGQKYDAILVQDEDDEGYLAYRPRRVRVFTLEARALGDLITEGRCLRCKRGVPEGARIVGAQYECATNCFQVAVEHDSFEEIPDGKLLPQFEPLFHY